MAKTGSTGNAHPTREPNNKRRGAGHSFMPSHSFGWRDIPATEVAELIQWVTGAGEGIILGCTSDGGALSITILAGDERVRQFPATIQAWDAFLAWVRDEYEGLQIANSD